MSGGVRNVYIYDCEFEGTDRAVRIKSRLDRGGVVENAKAQKLFNEALEKALMHNKDLLPEMGRNFKIVYGLRF